LGFKALKQIGTDLTVIPRSLKAKSADELTAKMLALNISDGINYKYQINHDGKDWYAWYLKDGQDLIRERFERGT
jgi:hypothetical protein